MKRAFVFFISLILCSPATAQKIFFRAGAGYALPLSNSRPVYLTGFPYTGGNAAPDNSGMFEVKKASMFSGTRATGGVGVMFSRIGFEVSASAVLSDVAYSFSGSLGGIYPPGTTTTITQRANNPVVVMPAVVMNVPGKKIDVLLRAGIALPVHRSLFVESETTGGAGRYYDKSELKTNFGIGFAFSGGVEYKLTQSLRAYTCIDILTMTLKAKESVLISSSVDGNDALAAKFPYQKKTLYVDDLTNYSFTSSEPRQQQSYSIPFGTKGISLGLSYRL